MISLSLFLLDPRTTVKVVEKGQLRVLVEGAQDFKGLPARTLR
jgi:hypothetical protein